MSKETLEYLNFNTLIGCTDNRENAWHYREELQGDESNHYPGAIPVGDVQRRLFHWDAIKVPVLAQFPSDFDHEWTALDDDGNPVIRQALPGLVAVARNDTNHVFKIFTDGYEPHQYREWLLNSVSTILGDTLVITSAGLLRQGGQAWVEVSVPETLHDAKTGFAFRPNLLAATSLDGSLATTYARTITAVVCHAKDTHVVDGDWRGLVQDHPTSIGPIRSEGREIAVWGLPFTEKVSGEHRYWTRERRRSLTPSARRELGVATSNIGEDRDARWVFANSLSPVKHEIGTPIDQTVGELPGPVDDLGTAWLVGYWWGNGHHDPERGSVTVSIPNHKPEVLDRVKAITGTDNKVQQKQGCIQYTWTDWGLANALDEWERPGYAQKVPPIWAEKADPEWQFQLVSGYFEADGNTGNTEPGLIIVSVSLDGLLSLRTILARLGIASSIRKGSDPALRSVIQGRKVHAQEQFSIRFIDDRFGYQTKHARTLHPYIEDGYLWSRVQHASPWEGEVYPITCDDHRYVTPFGLSHNCDNTLSAALSEKGTRVKVRHSRYSSLRLEEARESLNVIEQAADDFTDALHELTEVTVTDKQWFRFLDAWQPIPEEKGRGKAIATRKREELTQMYRHDSRVCDWTGTAWGVIQAVNTHAHHIATVKGASRAERNAEGAVTGKFDQLDQDVLGTVNKVLARA